MSGAWMQQYYNQSGFRCKRQQSEVPQISKKHRKVSCTSTILSELLSDLLNLSLGLLMLSDLLNLSLGLLMLSDLSNLFVGLHYSLDSCPLSVIQAMQSLSG